MDLWWGGIGKSIPSALKISLEKSFRSREISWASGMNFPIPPSFWWSTDTISCHWWQTLFSFPEMKMCSSEPGAVWKPKRFADFSADGNRRACPHYHRPPPSHWGYGDNIKVKVLYDDNCFQVEKIYGGKAKGFLLDAFPCNLDQVRHFSLHYAKVVKTGFEVVNFDK